MTELILSAVLSRLRKRDRDELAELGLTAESAKQALAAPAILTKIFYAGGQPQAIAAIHALTPKSVCASLVATDAWPRVARSVWKWAMREAKPELLAQGFTRAECRTMQGHDAAIRFLERLGFVRECDIPDFGANGATFFQYAWRQKDHVPFQIPENSSGPATAAARVSPRRGTARTQTPAETPRPIPFAIRVDAASRSQSVCAENAAGSLTP